MDICVFLKIFTFVIITRPIKKKQKRKKMEDFKRMEKIVKEEDSILNSKILKAIETLINNGGDGNVKKNLNKNPKIIISNLVNNYVGYSQMINLTIDLLK
jgi:hypothetical protein